MQALSASEGIPLIQALSASEGIPRRKPRTG
jgi:hypothetical protein